MSPELDLLLFPLPGAAGVMAASFEAAGWDGIPISGYSVPTAVVSLPTSLLLYFVIDQLAPSAD